jgi:2-(1,2-epoxy-1,2-dihydrophenyl)acetyl-CoA isomerase
MADQASPVLFDLDDGVARLRFNRPENLNALDQSTAEAFADAVTQILADKRVRVIVISGEGRAFAAGGDLAAFRASDDRAGLAEAVIRPFHSVLEALGDAPQAVICMLHGSVAGAGMSIAAMADLAIAAEDASFTMAYSKVGVPPDCGGSWALPRLVGLRRALELALLSPVIDAAEACRIGLVNRVVPRASLEEETMAVARRLAASAPLAMGWTKALMRQAFTTDLASQLAAEQAAFKACAGTDDFNEALEAFFGKRRPVFTGN